MLALGTLSNNRQESPVAVAGIGKREPQEANPPSPFTARHTSGCLHYARKGKLSAELHQAQLLPI